MHGHVADEELLIIERIASGEKEALEEIYERFGQALFRYILRLVGDRQLAEEVLQDTLVAVWRGASRFEQRSSLKTWLLGIARRQARDARRRRRQSTTDAQQVLEVMEATEIGPEEAVMANDRHEELLAGLRHLASPQQETLRLVFFQQLSYEETATVLGVSIGTVRSRLNRAKRVLRAHLRSPKEMER